MATQILPLKLATLVILSNLCLFASEPGYRSVTINKNEQLYITSEDGRSISAPRLNGQVAFGSPKISADHQIVGWLVNYPNPFAPEANNPVPGALVLYRSGRIVHTFISTDQVFWDWQFQDRGKRVAYSIGPTHGGADECILADIGSGKIVARWWVTSKARPPDWAKSLRR